MNETGIFNETNSNGYRYHSQLICIAVFIRILMSGLKPDPPAADHFREFYTQILHFLRKRTDNTSDAADMTQDVFTQWLGYQDRENRTATGIFVPDGAQSVARSLASTASPTRRAW